MDPSKRTFVSELEAGEAFKDSRGNYYLKDSLNNATLPLLKSLGLDVALAFDICVLLDPDNTRFSATHYRMFAEPVELEELPENLKALAGVTLAGGVGDGNR